MYKQVFSNVSNKLSPKFTTLGNYLMKERMLPPSNLTRYVVGGFSSVMCYFTLDSLTKIYPIGKEIKAADPVQQQTVIIKGFSSNTQRVSNNLMTAGSIGIIGWYAPYITAAFMTFSNYVDYKHKLIEYSKYLHQNGGESKVEEK